MAKTEQKQAKLNEMIVHEYRRPDGSLRYALDFSNCPTMTEQHTAHHTNVNYLMEKYKPDELAQYLAFRNQYRQEILGHDFSKEPSLDEAMNVVVRSRKEFEALPDDIRLQFKNHLEFLKFIDNPDNKEKMIKMGILTQKQVDKLAIPETIPPEDVKQAMTPKKEER